MALKEIKTTTQHYWEDEDGYIQGEFKGWFPSGQLNIHCFVIDGKIHGEYKKWNKSGHLIDHYLYNMNTKLKIDPSTLTNKDKFELTLRYNLQWL